MGQIKLNKTDPKQGPLYCTEEQNEAARWEAEAKGLQERNGILKAKVADLQNELKLLNNRYDDLVARESEIFKESLNVKNLLIELGIYKSDLNLVANVAIALLKAKGK